MNGCWRLGAAGWQHVTLGGRRRQVEAEVANQNGDVVRRDKTCQAHRRPCLRTRDWRSVPLNARRLATPGSPRPPSSAWQQSAGVLGAAHRASPGSPGICEQCEQCKQSAHAGASAAGLEARECRGDSRQLPRGERVAQHRRREGLMDARARRERGATLNLTNPAKPSTPAVTHSPPCLGNLQPLQIAESETERKQIAAPSLWGALAAASRVRRLHKKKGAAAPLRSQYQGPSPSRPRPGAKGVDRHELRPCSYPRCSYHRMNSAAISCVYTAV